MRVSRRGKAWLTVAAAWPLGYILSGLFVLTLVNVKAIVGEVPPDPLPTWFQLILALHAATILVGAGITIFCLVYLFRYSRLRGGSRVLWAVLLVFAGILTAPWFVWRHIGSTDALPVGPAQG